MNKKLSFIWQLILLIIFSLLAACAQNATNLALTQTMTLQNTDVPNHYDQYESFGDGFVARILIKDTNNLSREEIVIKLVNLLLEHYKTNNLVPRMTIKDYKDVNVKIIEDTNNYDGFFTIVASITFSIIPTNVPTSNWLSFSLGPVSTNSW